MFENFIPTTNPDNLHNFLPQPEIDEVIIGGVCKHIFIIPTELTKVQYIEDIIVFYKQGLYIILEKYYKDLVITDLEDGMSKVEVLLDSCDTAQFRKNGLDTNVQMKIIKKDEDVLYTDPRKLCIKCPLDQ